MSALQSNHVRMGPLVLTPLADINVVVLVVSKENIAIKVIKDLSLKNNVICLLLSKVQSVLNGPKVNISGSNAKLIAQGLWAIRVYTIKTKCPKL